MQSKSRVSTDTETQSHMLLVSQRCVKRLISYGKEMKDCSTELLSYLSMMLVHIINPFSLISAEHFSLDSAC